MNFLVDAQLPPGLTRWLADQGHSAQHVTDVGLAGAEDSVIWNHALDVDAIIVTKDEDFAERTARTAVGPVLRKPETVFLLIPSPPVQAH